MSGPAIAQQDGVTNYLVPAGGTTHSVTIAGVFTNAPFLQDWRQFKIDNFPFQPQGVFIDNLAGTDDLVITILPLGWKVTCPAGVQKQAQFPAPNNQTCSIIGQGQATVIFVDFPVLPDSGLVNIEGTVNVNIAGVTSVQALPVVVPVDASGVPYNVNVVSGGSAPVAALNYHYAQGSANPVNRDVEFNAPAGQKLHRVILSISPDMSLAADGPLNLNLSFEGSTLIWQQRIAMFATGTPWPGYHIELDFSDFNLVSSGAGNELIMRWDVNSVGNAQGFEINSWWGS